MAISELQTGENPFKDADWGASLLGDKTHSVIFDNAKVKRVVADYVAATPFARGAEEILAWYDAAPSRRAVDGEVDRLMDALVAEWAPARS